MQSLFKKLPIRNKLLLILLATSGASTLLASLCFAAGLFFIFRTGMHRELITLGSIISHSTAAALTFGDRTDATTTLEALANRSYILESYIVTDGSNVFAAYRSEDVKGQEKLPADLLTEAHGIDMWDFDGDMVVSHSIRVGGQHLGYVILRASYRELNSQLGWLLASGILVMLVSLLCAYVISVRLQALISAPILHLARTMQAVSRDQNYTHRVDRTSDDELGALMDGFNEMLHQVKVRDRQLAAYSESLEQKVALRTRELEQTVGDLRHAMEAAQAATKAKSQFLANMSHEIRTPMNGVLGMTDLLLSTSLNDQQKRFASSVRRSAEGLLSIINDILDFSKIEAGKMALEEVDLDIREIVEDVLELLREGARRKGVGMGSSIEEAIPFRLLGDPVRVHQVLMNLVGNAIKFTEHGEVTVHASIQEQREDEVTILIAVMDTGIGIADDEKARIFEDFTQGDSSTTRTYGGTGLGLTIARQLVGLMGGTIDLESKLGAGSTFRFTLRLHRSDRTTCPADTESSEKGVAAEATDAPAPVALRFKAHILVVDDNLVNQDVTAAMLENLGCTVTVATNGTEALDLMDHTRFDLVLMDCQMPIMDGYTASRIIRERERQAGNAAAPCTIIALTAHAMPRDREACLAAGMDDYLPKPFTQARLAQILHLWIARRSADGAQPPPVPSLLPQAPEPPAGIDISVINGIRALQQEGTPDVLERVVGSFLKSAPPLIAAMREGGYRTDPAALERAAHTLKSSSAFIGCIGVSELCREVEVFACEGKVAEAAALVPSIEAEYARAVNFLATMAGYDSL